MRLPWRYMLTTTWRAKRGECTALVTRMGRGDWRAQVRARGRVILRTPCESEREARRECTRAVAWWERVKEAVR